MLEPELLRLNLEQAFDHRSWHGTNLLGSLRRLTPAEAAWRRSSDRHNIWEIIVHAAYWKYAVWRRLTGEKRGSFPLKGSNWFARPIEITEKALKEDLGLLKETHRQLLAAVEALPANQLDLHPPGSKFNYRELILGVAAHDLYHAGQIQLLKRMQKS